MPKYVADHMISVQRTHITEHMMGVGKSRGELPIAGYTMRLRNGCLFGACSVLKARKSLLISMLKDCEKIAAKSKC